jgi:chromosomal replication initiation ATPase DnaA
MINIDTAKLNFLLSEIQALEKRISQEFGIDVSLAITTAKDITPNFGTNESGLIGQKAFIKRVKNAACAKTNISVTDLIGPSRETPLPDLRAIAYTLIKEEYPKCSLNTIGRAFGNRDHSSVLFLLKKFKEHWQTEQNFREQYLEIKNQLKHGKKSEL